MVGDLSGSAFPRIARYIPSAEQLLGQLGQLADQARPRHHERDPGRFGGPL
jgi:hypothetical protein